METGIERFLKAQENSYSSALAEIKNGRKESHWMWYIFPQIKGLGRTGNSQYYGIRDIEEAKEYLGNPILKSHLYELCEILLQQPHNNATMIFGHIDSKKFRSSMTLFDIAEPDSIFADLLAKYFAGIRCPLTLKIQNCKSSQNF